jgi:uncharacterized LabA/DUF88 family protein
MLASVLVDWDNVAARRGEGPRRRDQSEGQVSALFDEIEVMISRHIIEKFPLAPTGSKIAASAEINVRLYSVWDDTTDMIRHEATRRSRRYEMSTHLIFTCVDNAVCCRLLGLEGRRGLRPFWQHNEDQTRTQKLVDTMIVADSILLARGGDLDVIMVVSDDNDMGPGVMSVAAMQREGNDQRPRPIWCRPTRGNRGPIARSASRALEVVSDEGDGDIA